METNSCLVNNSGITLNRPFLQVTREQFDVLYHVNIRAQFFLTQEIVKDMLAREGGTVCNVTSIHGLQGAPEQSVYAGTKGAIIAYTRALAVELAHRGVRVNAIAPGWVPVENHYKAIPGSSEEAAHAAAKNTVPVARAGMPLDIARLAAFLCSDDAGRHDRRQDVHQESKGGQATLFWLIKVACPPLSPFITLTFSWPDLSSCIRRLSCEP